tara:strand:- start:7544 stop:7771 length:228 start_codon:yes stop_codon:yes gene_type:complete
MIEPINLYKFVDYVESFYGDDGVIDLRFKVTREHIWNATCIHLLRLERKSWPFEGDSVDREMVADLMRRAEFEHD